MNIVFLLLAAVVQKILQSIAQGLWDGLWATIFQAVAYAEQKWAESGHGAEKKQWAKEQIMAFVNEKAQLSWIQRMLLNMFLDNVIDALVKEINDALGHDWTEAVKGVEKYLNEKIPFIK